MEKSGPEEPKGAAENDRSLRCTKCGHRNPARESVCESCGSHLYLLCRSCGHRCERSRLRCPECHHKLHRSWFFRRSSRGKDKVAWFQVLLLLAGILIGLALVVYFSELRLPDPESRLIAPGVAC